MTENIRKIYYVHSNELIRLADKNPAVKNRASLVHELIASYDLLSHMHLLPAKSCSIANLRAFHSADYVQCLLQQPQHSAEDSNDSSDSSCSCTVEIEMEQFGLSFDCPLFANLQAYACHIAGATLSACQWLCKTKNAHNLVLNWTGGWHHAQRDKAAGYCYVNDCVLGILLLLKHYQRVLYVDLDVHHGDGVEQAFGISKRVFTLSFHQHECGFYPGTGAAQNCGFAGGKGYAANFPYKAGISGAQFLKYFQRIYDAIALRFKPNVLLLQCGGDVIVGDPLGGSNLTPQHLIAAIEHALQHKVPALLLGGGGYHFSNTSRYWTQLTAALCQQELHNDIPAHNAHFLQYGADYTLQITAQNWLKNENCESELQQCAQTIEANLETYRIGV